MKAKKLLAVLLSLAVLVGLVPMAGMLTSAAEDPTVMYFNFTSGAGALGYYEGAATTDEYTIEFDYYIPESTTKTNLALYAMDAQLTTKEGSQDNIDGNYAKPFNNGINHFSSVVTCARSKGDTLFVPALWADAAAEIYIWNFSVKINGTANAGEPYTHGTAPDTSKTLSQYDWAPKTAVTPNYPADVDVYKFAFGDVTGESSAVWDSFAGKTAADKTYTWSFDYCLVEGDDVRIFDAAEWDANKNNAVAFAATEYPTVGNHSFSKTFTLKGNGRFIPALQQTQSIDCGDLYVWNFSLVEEGTSKNLFDDVNLTGGNSSGLITKVQSKPASGGNEGGNTGNEGGNEGSGSTGGDSSDPQVYEITFPEPTASTSDWDGIWLFSKLASDFGVTPSAAGLEYTISFDYYLDSEDNVSADYDVDVKKLGWPGGYQNYVSGDTELVPGTHNFEMVMNSQYDASANAKLVCRPYLTQTGAGKLYIWNVKVTANGQTWSDYGKDGQLSDATSGFTSATTAVGKKLSTYNFPAATPDGGDSGSTDSSSFDKVYRCDFHLYDWEDPANDFAPNVLAMYYTGVTPKEGDKVTISFDYAVMSEGSVSVFNPYSVWANHAHWPGFVWSENPDEDLRTRFYGPKKANHSFTFTADADDAKRQITIAFESNVNDGLSQFYFWNMKITINDSDENMINGKSFYGPEAGTHGNPLYSKIVDIDPATITPDAATGGDGGNDNEGGNTGNDGGNDNAGGNTDNDGGDDNDGGNDTAGDDEDESPDTGDAMTGVAMAAVVLALAGAALLVSKKRKA